MDVSMRNVFIWIFLQEHTFGLRGKRKLGNGLLKCHYDQILDTHLFTFSKIIGPS